MTRDPRCPVHPGFAAHLTSGGGRFYVYWTCVACGRFLGLASLQSEIAFSHPSVPREPYQRRLPAREMEWEARDWDWLLARSPEPL